MQQEIRISKTMLDAILASVSNISSIFEKNLENGMNVAKGRVFELRNLIRETLDVARLKHPEDFGKVQSLTEILASIHETTATILELRKPIEGRDQIIANAELTVKLERKLSKLLKAKDRLSIAEDAAVAVALKEEKEE